MVPEQQEKMTNKNNLHVQPVILCGGSGTRLWPLSRAGFPKQFLCLTGNESLFQQATCRLAALCAADIEVASPYIVSGEEHWFLAPEQLREIGIAVGAALLEPVGRNTAPALTLAALAALEDGHDPILVVTPADQTVADNASFTSALQQSVREAANGSIVILGIAPGPPRNRLRLHQGQPFPNCEPRATSLAPCGRGAGERGTVLPAPTLTVQRFVEKPNLETRLLTSPKAATTGMPGCSSSRLRSDGGTATLRSQHCHHHPHRMGAAHHRHECVLQRILHLCSPR